VVNALSTRMEVEIRRDGRVWTQTYVNTVPEPLQQGAETDETGTTLAFWADPLIFTESVHYSHETLHRRLQEMAFSTRGCPITLRDERPADEPVEEVVLYPGGLVDFVKHLNHTRTPVHASVIEFTDEVSGSRDAGGAGGCSSRWRCSGATRTASRSTPSPTPSTPTRAARTRRASGPR
jgi:DNA gyrase subunit B